MKTYTFDVVEEVTYSTSIEAETQEEAEKIARERYVNEKLDVIDSQLAFVDLVDEEE